MHQFFVAPQNISSREVIFKGNEFHHLIDVLRGKIGERVIVNDNQGSEYEVILTSISRNLARGQIEKKRRVKRASVEITLAQALPKGKKMDWVVQKNTEIGVAEIVPIQTARTMVQLSETQRKTRPSRWQEIAKQAAQQSRRSFIPQIAPLTELEKLKWSKYDLGLILWEGEREKAIRNLFPFSKREMKRVLIVVGPEGGFTSGEICFLKKQKKVHFVSLGEKILRTETAGLVAVTIILYELGEIG
jgi:16S rRNA (uracil1498-N3)-methyltransferase